MTIRVEYFKNGFRWKVFKEVRCRRRRGCLLLPPRSKISECTWKFRRVHDHIRRGDRIKEVICERRMPRLNLLFIQEVVQPAPHAVGIHSGIRDRLARRREYYSLHEFLKVLRVESRRENRRLDERSFALSSQRTLPIDRTGYVNFIRARDVHISIVVRFVIEPR